MELFTELTVREHLVLARRVNDGRERLLGMARDLTGFGERPGPGEDEAVEEILALLGLEAVADRPALAIPLGTGRLLEVARALASEPTVMLLDEPSSGLDVHETQQLGEALRRVPRRAGHRVRARGAQRRLRPGAVGPDHRARLRKAARGRHPGRDPHQSRSAGRVLRRAARESRAGRTDRGGAAVSIATPLLEVTDLQVAYGEARALFGVSFNVPRDR